MRSYRSKLLAATLLATTSFVLSGCGDDSPTGNAGDALSAVEAQLLVAELFGVLQLIEIPPLDPGPTAVASGPARTPYGDLYDDEIGVADACTGGGLATIDGLITGDVDEAAGTADISLTATADFNQCVVPTQSVSLTLNGDPDVGLSADIDITDVAISVVIDLDGGVSYVSSDGRAGTCAMDLTITANAGSTGVSEVISGSACGTSGSELDIALFD